MLIRLCNHCKDVQIISSKEVRVNILFCRHVAVFDIYVHAVEHKKQPACTEARVSELPDKHLKLSEERQMKELTL